MTNRIYYAKFGGGYTHQREIIIDAAEVFGAIEVMALDHDGGELDSVTVADKAAALVEFNRMVQKYAEPFQAAINAANLQQGRKYTLVYCNEFGFPVADKITFDSLDYTTYAQHSDAVKMVFKRYRARKMVCHYFYNKSLMIFEGWQDLDKSAITETLRYDGKVKVTCSKYACFDHRYIDDLEKVFKNPVMIYKAYKQGVNGRLYA